VHHKKCESRASVVDPEIQSSFLHFRIGCLLAATPSSPAFLNHLVVFLGQLQENKSSFLDAGLCFATLSRTFNEIIMLKDKLIKKKNKTAGRREDEGTPNPNNI